jgi:hypothetical protein
MIALLAAAFAAPVLDTGNTAHTLSQADSKLTVGVFRPLSIRVSDRTDLITTGVLGSLVSPRLDVKHRLVTQGPVEAEGEEPRSNPLTVSLIGGLNVPTPILTLGKGWIFGADDKIPLAFQAKVGVLASRQIQRVRLTGGAELRAGAALGENDLTPRDFFFLDWALAPLVEGPVAGRFKLQADLQPVDPLLFTVELHMQITPVSTEFVSRWWAMAALGDHTAIGAGIYTQLDQRPNGLKSYFVPGADFQLRY